ncbi:MAG: hypothetical protein Q8K04_07350 [Lutibacter sp.]|nr:hypothetical protein [Lutibacter sp.]
MLESLIFMILSFIGIIGLIISIIILIIGLIKKSRKLKMTGMIFLMIPIFCYGLIYFWYNKVIPNSNDKLSNEFVGKYSTHKIKSKKFLKRNGLFDKERFLILKADGTYEFDTIPGVNLWKTGKWKTGGIDGAFEFYNEKGEKTEFGFPFGSGENCGLEFDFRPNNKDFRNTEQITLIKTNNK